MTDSLIYPQIVGFRKVLVFDYAKATIIGTKPAACVNMKRGRRLAGAVDTEISRFNQGGLCIASS
jgi:hypothetical protein